MNIQDLRTRQAEALRQATKNDRRDALSAALSTVEQREKDRVYWVGQLEAAEFAATQARGELEAAKSNLQRAADALEAEISKAGE
jgi:hypothetical protein